MTRSSPISEGDRQVVGLYHGGFSDAHIEVEEIIAEGGKSAVRWVGRCTHDGELMGVPASGNQVEVSGITLYRISEGGIAKTWTNYDAMGMMQQIGAIPLPEQARSTVMIPEPGNLLPPARVLVRTRVMNAGEPG